MFVVSVFGRPLYTVKASPTDIYGAEEATEGFRPTQGTNRWGFWRQRQCRQEGVQTWWAIGCVWMQDAVLEEEKGGEKMVRSLGVLKKSSM
jgi:hypothetical protein